MDEHAYAFFDSPSLYSGSKIKFFREGNSPGILRNFIGFLRANEDKIQSICASLYLFNNPALHEEFKRLAAKGIEITVVSIPLEGYDVRSPQPIHCFNTGELAYSTNHTKFSMAEMVYRDLGRDGCGGKYRFFIFPHMFVRSDSMNPFSRGVMPYSLHIKSFYLEYIGGGGAVALSTSNLAVRDQIKDEAMAIVENNAAYNESSKIFFKHLISNSIPFHEFDENGDYTAYNVSICPPGNCQGNFFIAPFYEDSPEMAGKMLEEFINAAEERVYICAQHVSAYGYTYPAKFKEPGEKGYRKADGFLKAALAKAKSGVDVRFLSQTFVDGNGDSHGCRSPANKTSFKKFVKDLEKIRGCKCAANRDVHSKFIIADDKVIITTCNFTPTQFIYLKHVDIKGFYKSPDARYKGIHSEVGQYMLLDNPNVVADFEQHFEAIWNEEKTYHHMGQIPPQ